MFFQETVFSGAEHPGTKPEVLESHQGFYVGFRDKHGLPHSRETAYFHMKDTAVNALTQITCALDQGASPRCLPYVR